MAKAKKEKTEKAPSDKPRKPRPVVFGPVSCYTRMVAGEKRYTMAALGQKVENYRDLPLALHALAGLLELASKTGGCQGQAA